MVNPYGISEQELLARTLMAEAGGEGPRGQAAVANVIRNRAMSGKYPSSIRDVILQPGQFSAFNGVTGYAGGSGANTAWQGDVPPQLMQIAQGVLDGSIQDPTGGALNYYNPQVADPSWGSDSWLDIGNHTFGTAGQDGSISVGGAGRNDVGGGGGGTMTPFMRPDAGPNFPASPVGRQPDMGFDMPAGAPPAPQDKSIMGRIKSGLGGIFGSSDNPTIASQNYGRRAERLAEAVAGGREVYNSNAPTSWLNVLADTVGEVGVNRLEKRQADKAAESRGMITELMSQGMTPEVIAQITELDPELGGQMRKQMWDQQEADLAYNRGLQMANDRYGMQAQRDERLHQNALELANIRDNRSSIQDERTSIMKEAEAMGYKPGSPEYVEYIRKRTLESKGDQGNTLSIKTNPDGSIEVIQGPNAGEGGVDAEGNVTGMGKTPEGNITSVQDGKLVQNAIPGSEDFIKQEEARKKIELKNKEDLRQKSVIYNNVQEAMGQISGWSTGLRGQLLQHVGGTEARNLKAKLDTIKSNLGFTQLQAMRDASPTGGALGQVTERELELLQSTFASLDQAQDGEQLREQLANLEGMMYAMATGVDYEKWFGFAPPNATGDSRHGDTQGQTPAPAPAPQSAPAPAPQQAAPGGPPQVNSQAEYDALPPGTQYIDSNGTLATKRGP